MIPVNNCTGCMECYNICPVGAITVNIDKDGFYSPVIDKTICVNCGLCEQTCPVLNEKCRMYIKKSEPKIYACTNKDENTRLSSSSGGMFSVFAEFVLYLGGYICGAILEDNLTVKHIISNKKSDIERMKGSKYIQSYVGDCYKSIKQLLENGKPVLFCGTPCQCAGLNAFLGKEYKDLIIVDTICSCINPPYTLKEYLQSEIKDGYKKILKINFRDKITGWGGNDWGNFAFSVDWLDNDGKFRRFYEHNNENLFFKGFLYHLWMKDSCNRCIFGSKNRCSDITIGDFWVINRYKPSLNDNKGLSFVMLNSQKSKHIFEKIKDKLLICEEVDYNWAINTQPVLNGDGMFKHKNRDLFFTYAPTHYSRVELTKDLLGINKVGIITLDFSVNFGAQLQTWACCEKIKELGFTPKVIHYGEHYEYTLGFEDDPMKVFRDKYIPRSELCYTQKELLAETADCNRVIIGGDQVFRNWNSAKNYPLLRYLGDFVFGEKVLASYGSSFGFDYFNGNDDIKDECKKLFKRFDKILVRETSGVEILKNTFGVEAKTVLDPVFLLNEEQYINLINNSEVETPENYIAYMYLQDDFGLASINNDLLQKFKNENIININANENSQYNSVEQWLNYIKNAKFVITDSFHCVAFCIIFKKPFIVVDRVWGGNSRIENILNIFNLQSQRKSSLQEISQNDLICNINWENVADILEKEKQKSINELLEILLMPPTYKNRYCNEELKIIRLRNELNYERNKFHKLINKIDESNIEIINLKNNNEKYERDLNNVRHEWQSYVYEIVSALKDKNKFYFKYYFYRFILNFAIFNKNKIKLKKLKYKQKIDKIERLLNNPPL